MANYLLVYHGGSQPADEAARMGCLLYGLEVAPSFRDPVSGEAYPRILNELRRKLSTEGQTWARSASLPYRITAV